MFGDIEIEENKFYLHKSPNFLEDVDIQKVLVPNKISSGEEKYKKYAVLVTCIMIIKLNHYV